MRKFGLISRLWEAFHPSRSPTAISPSLPAPAGAASPDDAAPDLQADSADHAFSPEPSPSSTGTAAKQPASPNTEFATLPLLARYAILHRLNPALTKQHFLRFLHRCLAKLPPLPPADKDLVALWERDTSEAVGLDLAMALESFGLRCGEPTFDAIAQTVRLLTLSAHHVSWKIPDSPGLEAAVAAAAAKVAEGLIQDCGQVLALNDRSPEFIRELARTALGWQATAVVMLKFRGKTHTFNHLACMVGDDISQNSSVLRAAITPLSQALPSHELSQPFRDFDLKELAGIFANSPAGKSVFLPENSSDTETITRLTDDQAAQSFDPVEVPGDLDFGSEPPSHHDYFGPTPPPDDVLEDRILSRSAPAARAEAATAPVPAVPVGSFLMVCAFNPQQQKDKRTRELIEGHKHVINTAVRLVETPDLFRVRQQLAIEFPYAVQVIDQLLNDLVGRTTVKIQPVVLLGSPGAGKSRMVRRMGEMLGVHVWRVDASHSDGNVFGGTDRRWASSEPCHPFLAISRGKQANPLVLVDEIDKASTRSDYGRLWDCLLGFLEPETSLRYPDPALQAEINVSEISYVCVANYLENLPHMLRDRVKIIEFPEPKAEHLDALIKPVLDDYLALRNIDPRWVEPITPMERDLIAQRWKGGSVRQLSRMVATVMRVREKTAVKH